MLFLAVFCGFLAEYQLEHKIEKEREKKFMRLLVKDLQTDRDSIRTISIHNAERYRQSDSLRYLLLSGNYKTNGSNAYYYGRNISRRRSFLSADGTLQQLKNSGSLRLIHNQQIVQQLIAYDVTYRAYLRQLEIELVLISNYRDIAARVFDAGIFQVIVSTDMSYRPPGNPALFDNSPAAINELSNRVNYIMGGQFRLNQLLDELDKKAGDLLLLINKTYHL